MFSYESVNLADESINSLVERCILTKRKSGNGTVQRSSKSRNSPFRSALQALDSKQEFDKLAQLIAFRSAVLGKNVDDCLRDTMKQAQGEALPEDVFLLPTLPQVDIGPAVILLREIVGTPLKAVCFRTVDATSNATFLRIGRLESTFKYAVSQAFGSLYSRIGLPQAYEARCTAVIEQIITSNWD